MSYEVVIVGGGIGGLTTAALLAARGVSVCLFEKEARVGGCAATFQKFGYEFEAGASLYASWQPGEIHERVFSELPTPAPEVRPVSPPYVVRLPDGTEVRLTENDEEFEESLRAAFPECARRAVAFYRELAPLGEALRRVARRAPDLRTASKMRRLQASAAEARTASRILSALNHTVADHLDDAPPRIEYMPRRGSIKATAAYRYAQSSLAHWAKI